MRGGLAGVLLLCASSFAQAAEPSLEVTAGEVTRSFTRDVLLARPDAVTVEVARDATYGKPMSYRAVPAAALLKGLDVHAGGAIETIATDGFTAQIPASLMLNDDPAKQIAWIAIEPADAPWPKIGGKKDYSAGPFYIVWTGPEVRSEYWAYQTARLVSVLGPLERWPQLAADPGLAADDPVRKGEEIYLAQCLPCHKLNGGGASDVGPDLNRPMNPTQYMTQTGLHALIRDPKSVRTWPGQKMNGWPPELLSDEDIDLIIAYLAHMAGRKFPE